MTVQLCDEKGIKVACTLQFTAEEKLVKILKGPIRDNLVDWGYTFFPTYGAFLLHCTKNEVIYYGFSHIY